MLLQVIFVVYIIRHKIGQTNGWFLDTNFINADAANIFYSPNLRSTRFGADDQWK